MRAVLKLVLVLLSISVSFGWSQTVGASLQGTIYDPSGAFVAGCKVEIHNLDTGAMRTLPATAAAAIASLFCRPALTKYASPLPASGQSYSKTFDSRLDRMQCWTSSWRSQAPWNKSTSLPRAAASSLRAQPSAERYNARR